MKNIFISHSVGISVDNHAVEVAELAGLGKPKIKSLGRKALEPGIVEGGKIQNELRLLEIIKKALLEAEPRPIMTRRAVLVIPEPWVYTHFFVPKTGEDSPEEIRKEAEKNIPLERQDLVFMRSDLGIVASSREWLSVWQNFFRKLRIDIPFFNAEPAAVFRGLANQKEDLALVLVDMGKATTVISFFDHGVLHSSHGLAGIGEIDEKSGGLGNKNDKNFFNIIKKLEPVAAEVARGIAYFKKTTTRDIKKIVLAGELAHLGGVESFFETNLSLAAEVGVSLFSSGDRHAKAVGAALSIWDTNAPKFTLSGNSQAGISKYYFSKKNIITACGVLAIAALIIFSWKWYTGKSGDVPLLQLPQSERQTTQFLKKEALNVKIPLALNAGSYTDQNLHGRVIDVKPQNFSSDGEALIMSLAEAEKELRSGEKLVPEPLGFSGGIYSWVAYSEADAKQLFLTAIDSLNTNHIQYQLESIEIIALQKTADINVADLIGKVTIKDDEPIRPEGNYVSVKETETGWLNVREAPMVSAKLIQKVYPGEVYMVLEEEGEWSKIKISEGQEGWAASRYLQKTE